jgi:hypothetical protein
VQRSPALDQLQASVIHSAPKQFLYQVHRTVNHPYTNTGPRVGVFLLGLGKKSTFFGLLTTFYELTLI